MKQLLIVVAIFVLLFSSACSQSNGEEETSRTGLLIYTTIYPIEYITKEVGGEHVTVHNLIPAGSDAHTFEPSSQTMLDIAKADAFIYSGAGLEGFAEKVKSSLKEENIKFIAATENIHLEHTSDDTTHEEDHAKEEQAHDEDGHATEEEHTHEEEAHNHVDGVDPHLWLDPLYTIAMAETITANLSELQPKSKADFEENFTQLKEKLLGLHQEFEALSNQATSKEFIVAHAAYGYWEKRYGFKQVAVSGLSPNQEPSQKELKEIIETAEEKNIKYVMFENNVSTKIATVVKEHLGADVLYLSNLESLTPEQVESGEDYLSIMRQNLESLKTALQ